MKRLFCALAVLMLLAPAALAQVDEGFAAYENYGRVIEVSEQADGVEIVAEGYYGYHMDEEPSMTVKVAIGQDGLIRQASVVASKAQTQGFDAMITQEFLDAAYVGAPASPTIEVDAVAGATATSQAVNYAVQTAAYYAQNVYGYAADTDAADKAELSAVYPATYTRIESEYQPDAKQVGTVLYAAEGVAPDGAEVVGMIVKSAVRFAFKGSAGTGWTAAEPSAFTMAVVVDKATNQVSAWRIMTDGTKQREYFVVPDEKIDAYKSVVIDGEQVFDAFTDGLVLALEYEKESSEDGPVITGTSIVYTGKTEQGTFSSQLVRNCFRAAVAYYVNYAK